MGIAVAELEAGNRPLPAQNQDDKGKGFTWDTDVEPSPCLKTWLEPCVGSVSSTTQMMQPAGYFTSHLQSIEGCREKRRGL